MEIHMIVLSNDSPSRKPEKQANGERFAIDHAILIYGDILTLMNKTMTHPEEQQEKHAILAIASTIELYR